MNYKKLDTLSLLRIRIPILILLFSVVAALISTGIQLYVEYQSQMDQIKKRINQIELSSPDILAASIWKLDEEQIKIQLNSMLQIPDVHYVRVESTDLGDIVLGSSQTENFFSESFPLIYKSEQENINVGSLHVTVSLAGVYTDLRGQALLILAVEATKVFFVAAFLLLLIRFLVTRHLTRMVNYTRELDISKLNEPLRLVSRKDNHHTNNELDELVSAINTMLDGLRASHDELLESHDTLEQKVQERTQELMLAKEGAEQASQAKSEFLSTINHELRTPLTSIQGGLGLVVSGKSGELPKKIRLPLDIAYKNTQRLVFLVNDILDVATIESGHLKLKCESIDLKAFLQHVVSLNQAYGESFGVKLCLLSCPENLSIFADKNRLSQVMNNLLSNAIKFTHSGDTVEVSAEQNEGYVEIDIVDHGPGIAQEFRPHIFDKFTQEDSSDTRSAGGTGLGLNISKSIIEQHGASLDFDSEVGVGTRFYIRMPAS